MNKYLNIYENRFSDAYRAELINLLSFESLRDNATDENSEDVLFPGYNKVVRIDFLGLAGLTLLGETHRRVDTNEVRDAFHDILTNEKGIVSMLNKIGIRLEIRFLFSYLYSDFAHDLIYAEKFMPQGVTIDCFIKGNKYSYDIDSVHALTLKNIESSTIFKNQKSSLSKIQKWVSKKYYNGILANKVRVKFSPVSILACQLRINNDIFIDPYLFAKDSVDTSELSLRSPLTHISFNKEKPDFNYSFLSALNHFQYLWRFHDLTLYCKDATHYPTDLSNIKKPNEISYRAKAERVAEIVNSSPESLKKITESDISLYISKCKQKLFKYTNRINEHFKKHLFIGFSFKYKEDYAEKLEEFLIRHFGQTSTGLKLRIELVDLDPAKNLNIVFDILRQSVAGIFILTPDVDEDKSISYAKPNVYMELGFMMGHMKRIVTKSTLFNEESEQHKRERIFIWKHKKVDLGSNMQNIIHTQFDSFTSFDDQFYYVAQWLWDTTDVSGEQAIKALEECANKIQNKIDMLSNYRQDENYAVLQQHKKKIDIYLAKIKDWEEKYNKNNFKL